MLTRIRETFSDKNFLSRIWKIALPVTLQAILNMLTNMVDTIMIGRLGENAVGAVGLAGKVFFIVSLITFGVVSGMDILIAQYWGVRDKKHIYQVVGIGLVFSVACSLIVAGASFFAPRAVMGIFTNSEILKDIGAEYLKIVCLTYILQAVSNVFVAALRCTEIAKPSAFISAVAIVTNVFFNWCMIFGHCGFAAMGVKGAAIATLIARAVELILTLAAVKFTKSIFCTKLKNYFSIENAVLTQFIKTSGPVLFNEMLWGIGVTIPSLTYGRMGENASAAMTIVSTYQDIEVVGMKGLSEAAAVLMGMELGMGHTETAKKYEKKFTTLALMLSVVLMAFTLIIKNVYISIYDVQADTAAMINSCMIAFAITLLWRCDNNIIYIGTLRAGGDTVACMLLDIIPTWSINVLIVPLLGLKAMLPLWMVFIVSQMDELIKFVMGVKRVKQYKWLKNLNTELTAMEHK